MNLPCKLTGAASYEIEEPYAKPADHVQSPFRYPGGKFYALKYIIPFLHSAPHVEYREPFVGGGSVFFGKRKATFNWINDLESALVTTYTVFQSESLRSTLIEMLSGETASRERHAEIKAMIPCSDVEVAFRTHYLNRTSYSGIIHKPAWGYKIGNSITPENWGKYIDAASKKLADVKITNLDFEKVVTANALHGTVLMYLDPPYYHADQKRAYTKPFEVDDHHRLSKVLKDTEHLFCLSYDDCDEIRELYHWAFQYERSWFYNTANTRGKRMIGNELIITNFEARHPAQLGMFG